VFLRAERNSFGDSATHRWRRGLWLHRTSLSWSSLSSHHLFPPLRTTQQA
jgi:hypothetical protein